MATTGQVLTTTDRVLQPLGAPRWSAHPYLSAVVRDLIRLACCWAMSPGWTADRGGYHLVDGPVRRPGTQEGVIEGRSKLQCCNRPGPPAGQ